jgi:hypothetical protein
MSIPGRHDSVRACGLALLLAASWTMLAASWTVLAGEPDAAPDAVDPQIARQVRQSLVALDADAFADREKAAGQLHKFVEDPRLGAYLAGQFATALLDGETSFEVRAQLESLLKELPPATKPPGEANPSCAEIAPLLDRLNSDSSAARDSAKRRLDSMLDHVELIGPMLVEVKGRLADPGLNLSIRRALEPVLEKAREMWVAADPASVPLPAVSDEEIRRCIDDLVQQESAGAAPRVAQATARRELLDLVVRDETRSRVLTMLNQRFPVVKNQAPDGRVQEIVDFAKPAMAAEVWDHQPEIWEHRQHKFVQHLIVGVPQYVEIATRPTHFDRIDDHTAHCVSGNTLLEGDYPVGVAIPHPHYAEVMYYLINLSTPRRRMAYEYHLKRDESQRLLEISQRTLSDFLAHKRVLTELQVLMLAQLDPHAVSRFVGPYFQAVPDERLFTTSSELAGQLTVHGGICFMLSRIGTHEAVPALEQTARSGELGRPTYESPFQMAWIAALAIAQRDSWPEIDAWLARLIDSTELLVTNVDPKPELGATAAAILLDRYDLSARSFGLETAGEAMVDRSRFVGYRYSSDKSRQDVRKWWAKQSDSASKKSAP